MKIQNISAALRLAEELRTAKQRLDLVRAGHALNVSIQSAYMGDEFVERCRPTVVTLLENTITEIEDDLRALGVEL